MIILDANILIYAYNDQAPQCPAASAWLTRVLSGTEPVGLPWTTIWAFLRVTTSKKIWQTPGSPERAFQAVRELLEQPSVILLNPGPRHAELLEELVIGRRAIGPLVSDAAVAALAIENGAVLASTDRDFSRFPNLRWIDPLVA
jgi:toxin-antitoxin system PIN domain toxin